MEDGEAGARRYNIDGHAFAASRAAPGLYVVATPIGNLRDVTLRALETLAGVDVVACEDTRQTRKLLDRYGIRTRLMPYHEHSGADAREHLLTRLEEGESIALVSDAGTPLVSDPGFRLVAESRARGLTVHPIPGPSALTATLSAAGLPSDTVLFLGFLSAKAKARRDALEAVRHVGASLVLYESPGRTAAMLADASDILGADRPAVMAREVTKLHETFRSGTLGQLAAALRDGRLRGEVVLMIGPPVDTGAPGKSEIEPLLRDALARASLRDAVDEVAGLTGARRRTVYDLALAIAKERG